VHVEFKPTRDSIAAFADDYVATSPRVRKHIFRMRLFFGLILLPWGLSYAFLGKPYAGIVPSVLPVLLILLWPRLVAWSTRRSFARENEASKRPPWTSDRPCRLAIDAGKLVLSNADLETQIAPSALEALHETSSHVFIYTSPNAGIAVPRAHVLSGNLEEFTSELRARMDAA